MCGPRDIQGLAQHAAAAVSLAGDATARLLQDARSTLRLVSNPTLLL